MGKEMKEGLPDLSGGKSTNLPDATLLEITGGQIDG